MKQLTVVVKPFKAEAVLSALTADTGGSEIFLDVPGVNHEAVALAQGLGLAPVFETARLLRAHGLMRA